MCDIASNKHLLHVVCTCQTAACGPEFRHPVHPCVHACSHDRTMGAVSAVHKLTLINLLQRSCIEMFKFETDSGSESVHDQSTPWSCPDLESRPNLAAHIHSGAHKPKQISTKVDTTSYMTNIESSTKWPIADYSYPVQPPVVLTY
jgi:hypothetical protein